MLKNKLLISAILITMCSCAMLASCGDGTRVEETNGTGGTQATEKENNNVIEDIGSDIQNGMGDVEDATHGIIDDQNGSDSGQSNAGNENGGANGMSGESDNGSIGNNMPGSESGNARERRHRGAVPFGK